MKKICVYGKGGIGKSTTVSNLAAACAKMGYRVAVVGCDPKADSTRNLMGRKIPSILSILHQGNPESIAHTGYLDVLCMESGGPQPATGCAGRGIVVAIEEIRKQKLLEGMDVVFFDVLGDVVCGGFATPLREDVADLVYIVTTSDFMSLYAANNISRGIEKYAKTGGAKLGGIIHNGRSSVSNEALVSIVAKKINTQVVGYVPMSQEISRAEVQRKTVIEFAPESQAARAFFDLAVKLMEGTMETIPTPMTDDALEEICLTF